MRVSRVGSAYHHIICPAQILFTLCDHYQSVRRAVVTMQLEVAQRIVAKPSTKQYGILSVVFQLYARPQVCVCVCARRKQGKQSARVCASHAHALAHTCTHAHAQVAKLKQTRTEYGSIYFIVLACQSPFVERVAV